MTDEEHYKFLGISYIDLSSNGQTENQKNIYSLHVYRKVINLYIKKKILYDI